MRNHCVICRVEVVGDAAICNNTNCDKWFWIYYYRGGYWSCKLHNSCILNNNHGGGCLFR